MLMARNQANAIVESINKEMLEWGSGGTTIYMLQRLKDGQRLTSIEHHPEWAGKVVDAAKKVLTEEQYARWDYRLIEGGSVGQNATPFEECPAGLSEYIGGAGDIAKYDTILVDGVARGACLATVACKAGLSTTVYLHDAERPWYQWAQALFFTGSAIPADEGEYPPLLWKSST